MPTQHFHTAREIWPANRAAVKKHSPSPELGSRYGQVEEGPGSKLYESSPAVGPGSKNPGCLKAILGRADSHLTTTIYHRYARVGQEKEQRSKGLRK